MKAQELIEKLKHCLEIPTWYVMGGFGARLGKDYVNWNYKYNKTNKATIEKHCNTDPITFGFDCVGLIKSNLFFGFTGDPSKENGSAKYDSAKDWSVGEIKKQCSDLSTNFGENDLIPGELVFISSSHIGLYIGNGEVIECTPAWAGNVQRTLLPWRNSTNYEHLPVRAWDQHGKFSAYIEYVAPEIDWQARFEAAKAALIETEDALQDAYKQRDKAVIERDDALAEVEQDAKKIEALEKGLKTAQDELSAANDKLLSEEADKEYWRALASDRAAEIATLNADLQEQTVLQKEAEEKAKAAEHEKILMQDALGKANDEIGALKIELNNIKHNKSDLDGDGQATFADVWHLFIRVIQRRGK